MSPETDDVSASADTMSDAAGPPKPAPVTIDSGWEPWYAWHPVRLYMSWRLA